MSCQQQQIVLHTFLKNLQLAVREVYSESLVLDIPNKPPGPILMLGAQQKVTEC